jgi:hypothetical protein
VCFTPALGVRHAHWGWAANSDFVTAVVLGPYEIHAAFVMLMVMEKHRYETTSCYRVQQTLAIQLTEDWATCRTYHKTVRDVRGNKVDDVAPLFQRDLGGTATAQPC